MGLFSEMMEDEDKLRAEITRLRFENSEMRRTFGSHPLFQESKAEIERLRGALGAIQMMEGATGMTDYIFAQQALAIANCALAYITQTSAK